jgi:hypothetical protein
VTLRLADLVMLAMRQALEDYVAEYRSGEDSENHYTLLRSLDKINQPTSIQVEADDAGTLFATFVIGDEAVFSLPMQVLLDRPVRKPEVHEANEPQPA